MDMLEARKEALSYLASNSVGRQGDIAKRVKLRRETLNRYACGQAIPSDIEVVQRIYAWMLSDRVAQEKAAQKKQ